MNITPPERAETINVVGIVEPARPVKRQPSVKFMLAHPAHFLALGLGSGLSPIMPGTAGTLFGWLCFNLLSTHWPAIFTTSGWAVIIVVGFFVGVAACDRAGRALGVPDHGAIVWDEMIAIWLVLLLVTPCSFAAELGAVVLFRLFDMIKPPPIRQVERRYQGGFGVMIDDIVAAVFTMLVIALWRF